MVTEAEIMAGLGGSSTPPVIEEPQGGDQGTGAAGTGGADAGGTPNPNPDAGTAGATPNAGEPAKVVSPQEIFGETFKDKDWNHVKTELDSRNARVLELETGMAELSARQPEFADPEIAQYNAWVKNGGIKDPVIFNRVKNAGTEMADIDAVITQKILQNPAFIGHEEMLKQEILAELPLVSTETAPLTDQQIAFNKAKITDKAIQAREYLKTQQEKLQVPAALAPVDKSAEVAARKENWSVAADKMFSTVKTVPLHTVVKKDGGQEEFVKLLDYQVPENLIPKYKEQLVSFFSAYGEVNETNLKHLQGEFQKEFISQNYPYMLAQALDQQRTQIEEEYDKKYGGGLNPKSPGGVGNTVVTDVAKGALDYAKNI